MVERQSINGKEVWLKVDARPADRDNHNTIPTEYFTASYYLQEPVTNNTTGELVCDEDGAPKLFTSPVEALSYAWKRLVKVL